MNEPESCNCSGNPQVRYHCITSDAAFSKESEVTKLLLTKRAVLSAGNRNFLNYLKRVFKVQSIPASLPDLFIPKIF